ncbi:hypothetical protein [Aestuariivirga sp.]|uniref:hypothetical protein n=1 Tax=Aestuariivirga sp. TaxID=2650926 RepID=UPI0025B83369|nr:hypothetical protein [Aestuariivirga sp.]MCA3554595.1 hypothetical protein [Aestuariivirga sp.]
MVVLKLFTLFAAAVLSFFVIRLMMRRHMQPVRVRTSRPNRQPNQIRRLRQDPRTGIYYPEA